MPEILPTWKTHDVQSLKIFSNIKLIIVDLDGSLVPHGASEPFKLIVKLGRDLHHSRYQVYLTVATGRTLTGARTLIEHLELSKDIPIILYNGSLIVLNGSFEIISKKTFERETLSRVLDIVKDYRIYTLAYIINGPSISFLKDPYEYIIGWSRGSRPVFDFNRIKIQWQKNFNVDKNLLPSAILIDTSDDPDCTPYITSELNKLSDVSFAKSGVAHYIEVRPSDSNKGEALKYLAKYRGLSRSEILAFGDNDNDIEMIDWAGIGVSIGQASPGAKMVSDYTCRFDAASGALEVLRIVKRAKYYFFRRQKMSDTFSKKMIEEK